MTLRKGDRHFVQYGYKVRLAKITDLTAESVSFKFPYITLFGWVLSWYGPFQLPPSEFVREIRDKSVSVNQLEVPE